MVGRRWKRKEQVAASKHRLRAGRHSRQESGSLCFSVFALVTPPRPLLPLFCHLNPNPETHLKGGNMERGTRLQVCVRLSSDHDIEWHQRALTGHSPPSPYAKCQRFEEHFHNFQSSSQLFTPLFKTEVPTSSDKAAHSASESTQPAPSPPSPPTRPPSAHKTAPSDRTSSSAHTAAGSTRRKTTVGSPAR